jgi:hypothetical protein
MKKHIVSILRSPLGYLANFAATLLCYAPALEPLLERPICWACEMFCCQDDEIQRDAMF